MRAIATVRSGGDRDASGSAARLETHAAAAPASIAESGLRRRWSSRTDLSAAAPAVTGRAARSARARRRVGLEAAQPRDGERRAVARNARDQGGRLDEAHRQLVARVLRRTPAL